MIAFVKGRVASVGFDSAVVEVGGVGFEVRATPGTLADLRVGEPATLPTSLVVREDSLTLYGFADDDERTVFELLQTASGVGPRLAQAMLAVLTPDQIRRAVTTDDLLTLTKVPGIGKKGAQRIALELKDRLGPPVGAGTPTSNGKPTMSAAGEWREQVRAGLLGLGWSAREAEAAVDAVTPQAEDQLAAGGTPEVATLLKAALRTLSRA
jgi:Holliday junction DNA helicase RuvA